jgi:hypothetical protein
MLFPQGGMGSQLYFVLNNTQIRILTLLPGVEHSAICCTLETASLSTSNLDYIALSWTWGSAADRLRKIKINDRDFDVRSNLYDALYSLRVNGGNAAQRLWIDAVCINQDSEEKNQQVPLMAQIYTLARFVIVCRYCI